jgi:hypothetical protein
MTLADQCWVAAAAIRCRECGILSSRQYRKTGPGWGLLSRARISRSVQRRRPVDRRNEQRPQRGRSPDALARMAVTVRLATALPGCALQSIKKIDLPAHMF